MLGALYFTKMRKTYLSLMEHVIQWGMRRAGEGKEVGRDKAGTDSFTSGRMYIERYSSNVKWRLNTLWGQP